MSQRLTVIPSTFGPVPPRPPRCLRQVPWGARKAWPRRLLLGYLPHAQLQVLRRLPRRLLRALGDVVAAPRSCLPSFAACPVFAVSTRTSSNRTRTSASRGQQLVAERRGMLPAVPSIVSEPLRHLPSHPPRWAAAPWPRRPRLLYWRRDLARNRR